MKAQTRETRRILFASLFMLVCLAAALAAVLGLARSLVALGDEEWLKVAVWFVAAVIAVPVFIWAWKHLKRHRPTDAVPEKWRSRFRYTPRQKFNANLNAYIWALLGAAASFGLGAMLFNDVIQSPDSTLGSRLQFLVLMIGLPAAGLGIAIGIRGEIMAFAPEEIPIERRPRSLWGSICFWVGTACLLLITGTFLVLAAAWLAKVTISPLSVQGPSDFVLSAVICLIGGFHFGGIALSILRDEWKRRRQRSEEYEEEVEIVGGMARYTGGGRQP